MTEIKTVWITGASSGIGEALAYEYAQAGHKLLLSARRQDQLEDVARKCRELGGTAHVYPFDLAESNEIERTWAMVRAEGHNIDLLVNSGGLSQRSLAAETPLETDRKLFEVNFFGTVTLTKLVLNDMLQRGKGHLAVISSISGKFGFPLRSAYAAAKHALDGFFESVHLENKRNGIDVTIVSPGRIRTEIARSAVDKDGNPMNADDPGLRSGMPVDVCARKIHRALEKRKREALVGGKEILMVYLKRFVPGIFFRIAAKVNPV